MPSFGSNFDSTSRSSGGCRMSKILPLALCIDLWASVANAQFEKIFYPDAFAYYKGVSFSFSSGRVQDNCISDSTAARNAFELELLRAGIKINTDPSVVVEVVLNGGEQYSDSGLALGCTVSYEINLVAYILDDKTMRRLNPSKDSLPILIYWDARTVFSVREDFQGFLESNLSESAKTFAAAWVKARQH